MCKNAERTRLQSRIRLLINLNLFHGRRPVWLTADCYDSCTCCERCPHDDSENSFVYPGRTLSFCILFFIRRVASQHPRSGSNARSNELEERETPPETVIDDPFIDVLDKVVTLPLARQRVWGGSMEWEEGSIAAPIQSKKLGSFLVLV